MSAYSFNLTIAIICDFWNIATYFFKACNLYQYFYIKLQNMLWKYLLLWFQDYFHFLRNLLSIIINIINHMVTNSYPVIVLWYAPYNRIITNASNKHQIAIWNSWKSQFFHLFTTHFYVSKTYWLRCGNSAGITQWLISRRLTAAVDCPPVVYRDRDRTFPHPTLLRYTAICGTRFRARDSRDRAGP